MVALPRIRLVFGPGGSRLSVYVVGSVAAHVFFVAALLLSPLFMTRPSAPLNPIVVDLVAPAAAAPGPPAPPAAAAAPPPPPPPAEPPEGVRAAVSEPKKTKKPPPKEKPPEKKPSPPPPPPPTKAPPADAPEGPSGPPSGSSTVGDDESGSITAMETGDFELAWYRDSVTSSLYGHWVKPILQGVGEPYEVAVTFEIQRNGRMTDLKIEQPSGIPSFDRSALRAVSDAAPFPPLPRQWRKPTLSARFLFRLYPE